MRERERVIELRDEVSSLNIKKKEDEDEDEVEVEVENKKSLISTQEVITSTTQGGWRGKYLSFSPFF